jgi:hypothetical protein
MDEYHSEPARAEEEKAEEPCQDEPETLETTQDTPKPSRTRKTKEV